MMLTIALLGIAGAAVAVWIVALKRRAATRTAPGSPERIGRLRQELDDREGLIHYLGKCGPGELGDFAGALRGIILGIERNGIDARPQLYQQVEARGVDFPHRARAELSEMDVRELRQLLALVDGI